jgi:hypothetical protein
MQRLRKDTLDVRARSAIRAGQRFWRNATQQAMGKTADLGQFALPNVFV